MAIISWLLLLLLYNTSAIVILAFSCPRCILILHYSTYLLLINHLIPLISNLNTLIIITITCTIWHCFLLKYFLYFFLPIVIRVCLILLIHIIFTTIIIIVVFFIINFIIINYFSIINIIVIKWMHFFSDGIFIIIFFFFANRLVSRRFLLLRCSGLLLYKLRMFNLVRSFKIS